MARNPGRRKAAGEMQVPLSPKSLTRNSLPTSLLSALIAQSLQSIALPIAVHEIEAEALQGDAFY